MTNPIAQLIKVTKTYYFGDQPFHALQGVSLSIYPNDFLAIIGPSGSGKSTIMHLTGILDVPSQGRILFKGRDVTKLNDSQLAKIRNQQIGFVFQQFFLLSYLNAIDNVALPLVYAGVPLAKRRQLAIKMLEKVGLKDKIYNRPNQLSGGQQQRVAIARALINKPSLVLADEPTGNLDSVSGRQVLKLFADLHKQGHTIVIVTHDPQVAKITRKQVHLKDGKIIKIN
ncbi:MAG: ABC transporter ATP-binding protein [bacterium]|nr:ABC transporter ATP-binding protein [bacterium]